MYPLDATRFEYASVIITTEAVPQIPEETLTELKGSENIDAVVPVTVREIVFSVPASTTHTPIFSAEPDDLDYLMDKFQIEISEGRMPVNELDEIAIDENVAKNNGLEIGSKTSIDVSHNLNREYTVVGILESDSHISFVDSPTTNDTLQYGETGYLVFHAEGCIEDADNEVTKLSDQGLTVFTLSLYNRLFEKNNQTFQVLDMMVIFAVIVMVVCLVCSKYAQFFARKQEIGILNAIGYNRSEISKRTVWEIVFTNLVGFVLGLLIAIILCRLIVTAMFDSLGGTGVYLYAKAAGISLLAPVLTTIFTLIPINRLINKVDAISIITSN